MLGYIFEKYINKKQMGAYYTQEDITGYIAQVILLYVLEQVRRAHPATFDASAWPLLGADPDRYIYPAARHGADLSLPEVIAAGLEDVNRRGEWNRPAPPEYALPTELWREVVARRRHVQELRQQLQSGAVQTTNDLLTHNLDIRQFAQDIIEQTASPDLLRAFWKALTEVKVLDPTVGSGAFLFAALNTLDPLYEACLERMQVFLDELDASLDGHRPEKFKDFRAQLERVAQHPNQRYFVLKSIIIHNLYGVDLMEEAVEICKLRLFLKLIAQVESAERIEPLPDIDFNVRAGNTLVGFARLEDAQRAFTSKGAQLRMLQDDSEIENWRRFEQKADDVAHLFSRFRQQQTELGGEVTPGDKQALRQRLAGLDDELNQALARQYQVDPAQKAAYQSWLATHRPLHWCVEFYAIMKSGGFDVIIGNPPYVVYNAGKVGYDLEKMDYETLTAANLYCFVYERSIKLSTPSSPIGLIVQLTVLSSERVQPLQNLLMKRGAVLSLPFPRRPESIFDGVEMPVAIVFSFPGAKKEFTTTRVQRFYTSERSTALSVVRFVNHDIRLNNHRVAKIETELELNILTKAFFGSISLASLVVPHSQHVVYYQEACRYWVKAMYGLPFFRKNGKDIPPPHGRTLYFRDVESSSFATCLFNSSFFYWYYSVFSDCEHMNDSLIRGIKIPVNWGNLQWTELSSSLMESLKTTSLRKTISTKQGHQIEYDEIKASASKAIINEIDQQLGKCYGFTESELDFIINYDIKYRMGNELDEEENDDL